MTSPTPDRVSDRCPTCGSEDPDVRRVRTQAANYPLALVRCHDPWHDRPTPDPDDVEPLTMLQVLRVNRALEEQLEHYRALLAEHDRLRVALTDISNYSGEYRARAIARAALDREGVPHA